MLTVIIKTSCIQFPVDTSQHTPEDLKVFVKLVHDLLKDNK